jgi:hypothetical protein
MRGLNLVADLNEKSSFLARRFQGGVERGMPARNEKLSSGRWSRKVLFQMLEPIKPPNPATWSAVCLLRRILRNSIEEIWPSPMARRVRMKPRSLAPRPVWFGCGTIEGLNNATDSTAYSPVKNAPIKSHRLAERDSLFDKQPLLSQTGATTIFPGWGVGGRIRRRKLAS